MARSEEPTIWQNLPLSGDGIRILTIEAPTTDSNSIHCSLDVASLAKKHPYAALSYTWGNQPFDHVVHVNSKKQNVTKSCYEALKVFRDTLFEAQLVAPPWRDTASIDTFRTHGVRHLWVDQLCIDQTNQAEKVDQIMLMARIYAGAAMVWSYIGHALSPTALQAKMSHVSPALAHHPLLQQSPGDIIALAIHLSLEDSVRRYQGKPGPYQDIESVHKHPVVWIQLLEMLERSYFRRRWVVQEVSLNGSVWVFWDGRLFDLLSLSECAGKVYAWHIGPGAVERYESQQVYTALCDLYGDDFRGAAVMAGSNVFRDGWKDAGSPIVLFCLLFLCASLEQTEPQDRFFSLRSLAPVDGFPLPDYTAPLSKICRDYTLAFFNTHLAPLVLQCGGLPDPADVGTMPSWCPRWLGNKERDFILAEISLVTSGAILRASDSPPWPIKLLDSSYPGGPAIEIPAVFETMVSHVYEQGSSDRSDASKRKDVLKCHEFVLSHHHSTPSPPPPELKLLLETLKSAATADKKATDAILRQVQSLREIQKITLSLLLLQDPALFSVPNSNSNPNPNPSGDPNLLLLHQILTTSGIIHGKSPLFQLATTQNGLLGVVDKKVQPGDIVALIPGLWLPLILREKRRGKGEGEGEAFEIVGSAYLGHLQGRSQVEVDQEGRYSPFSLRDEDVKSLRMVVLE